MYSILIRNGTKYSYYTNKDNTRYSTDIVSDLEATILELLKTYTLDQIVPVRNCVITNNISVEEVDVTPQQQTETNNG